MPRSKVRMRECYLGKGGVSKSVARMLLRRRHPCVLLRRRSENESFALCHFLESGPAFCRERGVICLRLERFRPAGIANQDFVGAVCVRRVLRAGSVAFFHPRKIESVSGLADGCP